MVKHVLAAVIALAALAAPHVDARPPDYELPPDDSIEDEADESPAFNMFGFDMKIGALPMDGANALAMSIGLGIEHPVFRKSRVFAEYDWLWLVHPDNDARAVMPTAPRPEQHASGHRASLGLRRELVAKDGRSTRLFLDGELGGSLALTNDNLAGVQLMPAGFVGLRTGYDLYSRHDDSPSRTFETALLLRAIGVRDGVGVTFGIGMFWGN